MNLVAAIAFSEARRMVIDRVRAAAPKPPVETVPLTSAAGRVLAQSIHADRDYPPRPRSVRDGFAVRAADVPAELAIIGEVRAGEEPRLSLSASEAIEIMTGASVPAGADAVVMVEHVRVDGPRLFVDRPVEAGLNISPQGGDAAEGATLLRPGARIGYAEIALLASVGAVYVDVYKRPSVAILATGDELVAVDARPEPHQVRNSNSHSLVEQVIQAGGEAHMLPVAKDSMEDTVELIREGLQCDLLLLSGGVSAGKYDLVELALTTLEAEFFFDRVLIQPGQPCVFGAARGAFFFGLPGNPASTMVCYEVLARAAQELLSGVLEPRLPIAFARLTKPFRHKPGLTRFLPATLHDDGTITPRGWSGSGDIAALAAANAWLVADPEKPELAEGEWIAVLHR
jgi:molybdopterin molybdotransferase